MTVLMLRALGLGDFLTAVPAYRAIVRAFPRARRRLAAPAVFAHLADLVGGIEVVATEPLAPLDPALHGADLAVNLHGSGPQSHRVLLDAAPRRLLAYRNDDIPQSAGGPTFDAGEHEVRRWCRLLEHDGIGADPDDLELRVPAIAVPRRLRRATIVHVGAGAAARRWPIERWSAVVRDLLATRERVVITAGAGESRDAHAIAAQAGLAVTHVLAGRTSLRELAALVASAARVISTDTGVAHLATAYGTPSVTLFGPTSPATWGPPRRPYHRVLWAGRTGDPNAQRPDPGLLQLTPHDVGRALRNLTGLDAR